jgi:hypothetical protein
LLGLRTTFPEWALERVAADPSLELCGTEALELCATAECDAEELDPEELL